MKTVKQKLFEIYKDLKNIEKDTENAFTNNKYASEKAVLDLVKPKMIEQGLMLFTDFVITSQDPNGALENIYYHCEFRIEDCLGEASPEVQMWDVPLERKTIQGFGGLTTYLTRYFYLKLFQIATDSVDDPDKEKNHDPVEAITTTVEKVSFRDKIKNKEKK